MPRTGVDFTGTVRILKASVRNEMESIIRRHIAVPRAVIDEGALQVLYRGDVEAMERDRENGTILATIEQSFYNNISAYAEWIGDLTFDANAFTDDVDAVIVTPLRDAQATFDANPYLTRLFTTLSADEMTIDPMFNFNPDLGDVDNVRRATARCECPEGVPPRRGQARGQSPHHHPLRRSRDPYPGSARL